MIESPVAIALVGAALISGVAALMRRRSQKHDPAKRTEELIQKLNAAAREADEHIQTCLQDARIRGERDGW